jgi:hypothetical protein
MLHVHHYGYRQATFQAQDTYVVDFFDYLTVQMRRRGQIFAIAFPKDTRQR